MVISEKKTYSLDRTRSNKWRVGTRRNKHIRAIIKRSR